jgi:hypothetical protein
MPRTSPVWSDVHPEELLPYYPGFRGISCYGIHAQGVDRFLAVSGLDLAAVLHAAKLLSSKIPTHVVVFPKDSPEISNKNCLSWSIHGSGVRLSDSQTPLLIVLDSPQKLVEKGPVPGKELAERQEFVRFLIRASHAMLLTDAVLNASNQDFYFRFFADAPELGGLNVYADDTKWPGGFVATMSKILYQSNSINDALQTIATLLPTGAAVKNPKLQCYCELFYQLLGWKPGHA